MCGLAGMFRALQCVCGIDLVKVVVSNRTLESGDVYVFKCLIATLCMLGECDLCA